jgi:hypothetical protein
VSRLANPFWKSKKETDDTVDDKKEKASVRGRIQLKATHVPINDNTQYRLVSVDVSPCGVRQIKCAS